MKDLLRTPLAILTTLFLYQSYSTGAQSSSVTPEEAEGPTAVVTLGSGAAVTTRNHKGRFELVGLQKNEVVDIVMQYPAAQAGQRILAVPLDGGRVIAPVPSLVIAADGTLRFKFKVDKQPGIYQVALNDGTQEIGLRFWVRHDETKKNPRTVNN